jgi:hypothetical protein
LIRRVAHLHVKHIQAAHLLLQPSDLFLDPRRLDADRVRWLLPVGAIERIDHDGQQITCRIFDVGVGEGGQVDEGEYSIGVSRHSFRNSINASGRSHTTSSHHRCG